MCPLTGFSCLWLTWSAASSCCVCRLFRSRLFSEHEIHTLYMRFEELGGSRTKAIPIEKVINMEEFRYNPFRYRIGAVFGENVLQEAARDTMISSPGAIAGAASTVNASSPKLSVESKEEKKDVPTGVLIQTQTQLMRPNLKEKVCSFARFLELFEAFSVRYAALSYFMCV